MRRLLLVLVIAAACGKNNEPPPPSSGSPNALPESGPHAAKRPSMKPADQAASMYSTVCALCHGAEGRGDGANAQNLNPKPRDYTDPAWQASVTDDDLKKTILLGGKGTGKSLMMPGQPQLESQPEVLDGLIKIIRGFGKK